ncbi:MAG: molybdopterin-dependent oxidoreductase [Methanoregula sp.]
MRAYDGKDLFSINNFREKSIKGPQYFNISDCHLTVAGSEQRNRVLTHNEVLDSIPIIPRLSPSSAGRLGSNNPLGSVMVCDLIRDAGIDPRANMVSFTTHDGYTSSFPLDYLMNNDIIMAYRMNNVTFPAERGYPFQLVVQDKWVTNGSSGSRRSSSTMIQITGANESSGDIQIPLIYEKFLYGLKNHPAFFIL